MTKHYRNQDPAAPAPPTWQQTPRAVPPQLGRSGPAAAPAPSRPAPATPSAAAPSVPGQPGAGPGTQPATAGRGTRRGTGVRHWQLLVAAVVPCLGLTGIGWWVWPQQPTGLPPHVAAGTVQADLLSADSVSRLAGTTVVAGPQSDRPHTALNVAPSDCAIAAGPTTQSVFGQGWKAFLSATYQDAGGTGAYTVNQTFGVFPDTDTAGTAFQRLTDGLSTCPSATVANQSGRSSKWAYTARPAAENALVWAAAQEGAAGWACVHQARVKGATLVQVAVCQEGDGTSTASKITDELAGKVTG
ncbi:sensor domain-containing protein [Kitasatospora sp. NPDC049258]|uniref:sensor domain-containing protein n=1 Tax=Kitasatospora sp. NPDC049258 TaxID=3155394 RepID=UPI00342A4B59